MFALAALATKLRTPDETSPNRHREWLKALDAVPDVAARDYLKTIAVKMANEIAKHLVLGNPIPMLLIGGTVIVYGLARGFSAACADLMRRLVPLEDLILRDDADLQKRSLAA